MGSASRDHEPRLTLGNRPSSGQKLDVIEVTQNEDLQKFKIRVVLETANRLLGIPAKWANIKWTVEGIHSKQLVQLIHLLVALIRHYRAPIRLPQNVSVNLIVVQVSPDRHVSGVLFH